MAAISLVHPYSPYCMVCQEVNSNFPLLGYELDLMSCGMRDSLGRLRPSIKSFTTFAQISWHPHSLNLAAMVGEVKATRKGHMEREDNAGQTPAVHRPSPDIAHMSEGAMSDILVPGDTTWRRTKTAGTLPQPSCPCCLQSSEPAQLRPQSLGNKRHTIPSVPCPNFPPTESRA